MVNVWQGLLLKSGMPTCDWRSFSFLQYVIISHW